ncbi:hypothetical protein HJC23_006714, partial [Cyclotella cryptica]
FDTSIAVNPSATTASLGSQSKSSQPREDFPATIYIGGKIDPFSMLNKNMKTQWKTHCPFVLTGVGYSKMPSLTVLGGPSKMLILISRGTQYIRNPSQG